MRVIKCEMWCILYGKNSNEGVTLFVKTFVLSASVLGIRYAYDGFWSDYVSVYSYHNLPIVQNVKMCGESTSLKLRLYWSWFSFHLHNPCSQLPKMSWVLLVSHNDFHLFELTNKHTVLCLSPPFNLDFINASLPNTALMDIVYSILWLLTIKSNRLRAVVVITDRHPVTSYRLLPK